MSETIHYRRRRPHVCEHVLAGADVALVVTIGQPSADRLPIRVSYCAACEARVLASLEWTTRVVVKGPEEIVRPKCAWCDQYLVPLSIVDGSARGWMCRGCDAPGEPAKIPR